MRCRITLKAEGLRTIVVQYNAGNYLDAILVGRSRVHNRSRAWLQSGRVFRWSTELQNRRMEWQIIEIGDQSSPVIQEDKWARLRKTRQDSHSQRYTDDAGNRVNAEDQDAQEQQEKRQENLVQRANGLVFDQLRQWATSQEVTTDDKEEMPNS